MKPLLICSRTFNRCFIFAFILFVCASITQINAQDKSGINDLWCMEFFDETNGITIGSMGIVMQTSDGGLNWNEKTSGTINTLKKTAILTDDNIVVVGLRGTIIKTTDHGQTWTPKASGLNIDLYGVSFGGRLSETGIAVGDNGTILRSTDQGDTWNAVTMDINIGKKVNYRSVAFGSANNGVIVGQNGVLLLTSDGGLSWYNSPSMVPFANYVFAIMTNDFTAYATADNGIIIRSTNAGESWESLYTGIGNTLNRIRFADDQNATIVGSEGMIMRTTDGGLTWMDQSTGLSGDLNCLYVVDELISYAGGADGVILKTTDGGANWVTVKNLMKCNVLLENDGNKLSVYPNPSNPNSVINYSVNGTSFVTLRIYDILGKEMELLVNSMQNAGSYSVKFDGTKLSSGMYFCKMIIKNDNGITAKTMKIILVK